VESPRFFEGMLVGRHINDVAAIVARICGVCSNSHTLVSLAASEAAMGIEISNQTKRLRRLLAYGEILQSHLLQLYFMAIPDYLGVNSILPLAKTRRDLVSRALRLKKMANTLCQCIGGRAVHPVTLRPGGFATLPTPAALQAVRKEMVAALPDLEATVDLFLSLPVHPFERETEYFSLAPESGYPLFGEQLISSDGVDLPVQDFRDGVKEYLVPHSTAKFARLTRNEFMVGPLARYKNGAARLSPMAKQVSKALGLTLETVNPYHALRARLVEVVHCVEEAIHLIDETLINGLSDETPAFDIKEGRGCAAVEAPRGTLFHCYEYDESGCIIKADCIIPTGQNLGNIEADLRALVPQLLELPREEMTLRLEALVRAYDPCISCSTHLLKIDFV